MSEILLPKLPKFFHRNSTDAFASTRLHRALSFEPVHSGTSDS